MTDNLVKKIITSVMCLTILVLSVNAAIADISLVGNQSVGDNQSGATGEYPVSYRDFANYPIFFYLSNAVTLTGLRLQGESGQESDSRLKVVIDGTQVAEGGAGQDYVAIANLNLPSGLHRLMIRGDCYLPNGNVAPNCNGNKEQDDFSYTGIILESAETTEAIHFIQKYHLGDNADSNDGYGDITDSSYPYYPDAFDGTSVAFNFNLMAATTHIDIDFYRLRALDFSNRVLVDGIRVGVLEDGGDSVDLDQDPYTLSVDGVWSAGAHSLTVQSRQGQGDRDDFSWDEIIIRPEVVNPPLAEYRFDECDLAAGVTDSSGNGYDGTSRGAVSDAGKLCRGGEFDGDGDYIEVPDSVNFDSSFTVVAWINQASAGGDQRIIADDENNTGGFAFSLGDGGNGRLRFFSRNVNPVILDTPPVISTNTWYFVAAVHDSVNKTRTIYVDGVEVASDAYSGTWGSDAGTASIGGETSNAGSEAVPRWRFNGAIDEVLIFDNALGQAQVEAIRQNSLDGNNWDGSVRTCTPCNFCFNDDFNRATLGSNWTIIKQQNFTPQLSANKMVLTDLSGGIASGVTLEGAFPAQSNYVQIEFEHNAYGGTGADGIVLVLSDAAVEPVAGAPGRALGYAQNTVDGLPADEQAGFAGGWLGFAIDEYGNFSVSTDGNNGGPGFLSDTVVVRGHGNGTDGYNYLTRSSQLNPGVDSTSSSSPAPGHKYRFTFNTYNEKTLIKVERDVGTGYESIIDWYDATQLATAPDNFRLSITGSTGGANNYHSIDDFTINANHCGTIGGGIDHFEFIHDGSGLTCAAETIILKACTNADCSTPYSGNIDVTLPDLGWLNGVVQTLTFPASGEVSLALKHTTAEPVTLDVVSSAPVATNSVACDDGSSASCIMTFHDSGFLLAVTDGRSCTDLAGTIQAVRKDEITSLCVGDDSFAGTARDVGFWFDRVNPASGSVIPQIDGNSPGIAASAPGSDINISFNAQAAGTFVLSYADAGSLNLHARFAGSGAEAGLVMEGSTTQPFVVAPDHFEVTSTLNNGATGGTPVAVAGNTFSATIQAVCADNTLTPNYVAPISLTAITPYMPASGSLGTLANGSIAASAFSSGTATPSNLSYGEVGNFTLQAQGLNYLGSGLNIVGTSAPVGRFIPDHLELTQGTLTNRVDSSCAPESAFTYFDEDLTFTYNLTAKNSLGVTTQNYIGSFAKFDGTGTQGPPAEYRGGVVGDDPTGTATDLTDRLDYTSASMTAPWAAGTASFAVKLNVDRNAAPDGFYTNAKFGVFVRDSDGVGLANLDLDVDSDTAFDYKQAVSATTLGYGRISLTNAHGSELLDLPMEMQAQYWNGTSFVVNPFDSCTSLGEASLILASSVETAVTGTSPIRVKGVVTTTASINNQPLASGIGGLEFSAPGVGGDGWVDVELTVPDYLKFDWLGSGRIDPRARATFGIYKGNEHIIYLRETTWR